MKKYSVLFILFINILTLVSQPCPENLGFSSQTMIDNFRSAFPNCKEIEGSLVISDYSNDDPITNLDSLISIESIGEFIYISNCRSLIDISGLGSLQTVGDYFEFYFSDNLTSLSGLDSLKSIGGRFNLSVMGLVDLSGLEQLTTIGGSLAIQKCHNLESIEQLINLTSIGSNLSISNNNKLTSLNGLDNIEPGSVSTMFIHQNELLSECSVQSICGILLNPDVGYTQINSNSPGCLSEEEVLEACSTSYNEFYLTDSFSIYPNPAKGKVTIGLLNGVEFEKVSIINQFGQKVLAPIVGNEMDISGLSPGIYYLNIKLSGFNRYQKLIVRN